MPHGRSSDEQGGRDGSRVKVRSFKVRVEPEAVTICVPDPA